MSGWHICCKVNGRKPWPWCCRICRRYAQAACWRIFRPICKWKSSRRLVDLEEANPAVLHEVERALETRLSQQFAVQRRRVAGVEAVTAILNACDGRTSGVLLENLAACDRSLAERLGLQNMTFEDLVTLTEPALIAVFRAADPTLVQMALIGAPPQLVERLLHTMPPREARRLRKRLDNPARCG